MAVSRKTCLAGVLYLTAFQVTAQTTTVAVGSCEDWPSSVTSDTVLQLTAAEISCDTNTPIEVLNGASLEMTSMEASTKLNNVKVWVQEGSFLCTVPMLDWTSVETVAGIHGFQVRGGAAMRTEEETTTTFTEDVTFNACELPADDFSGGSEGAAVANFGTMVFQGNTIFKDTPDAGALYTWGSVTFEKDATFENNKSNNSGFGNGSGAGLYIDFLGVVTFQGSTFFLDNEVTEGEGSGGGGAALYSRSSNSDPMVFSGPVTVSGSSGMDGAFGLRSGQEVIFESLVTFTDNIMGPKLHGDSSSAGAMYISGSTKVELRGGVTATGNIAKRGGAFYVVGNAELIISSPAVITDNEARYDGGAIYVNEATVTLPADANISDNTATLCPGINLVVGDDGGAVVFDGGETYSESSKELCYLGLESDPALTPVDIVEEFDCEAYSSTAPVTNEHPYLVLDTAEVKSWDFGSGGGFSCDTQLIVYVTGGEELTVTSTASATTISNVHFEVIGFTSLFLDVPDLTIAGLYQSEVGGAIFVDIGSSLDVMNRITFQGNSIHIEYDLGLWEPRGGAAVFSAGTTTFHGRADFLGNGQYDADANGYEPSNEDGGALANYGSMTFMQKGTFTDNFNPNGGNGGAIANFGDITFSLRAIFKNNSVGEAYTDDGEPYGGRGGAVWNSGESSTILFNRLAIFKENVGALGGCALATRGYIFDADDDELEEGDSRITFADKAKFKDNYCDVRLAAGTISARPRWADENKGGGAILAYGATTIEFADTAVFKRNEAVNAGAIRNSGTMLFVSDDKLVTADNVATDSCPDILNNDVGTITIGTESFLGPSAGLCERSAA
ncbi:unnamed protein product [Scytosiphon promiscuus]